VISNGRKSARVRTSSLPFIFLHNTLIFTLQNSCCNLSTRTMLNVLSLTPLMWSAPPGLSLTLTRSAKRKRGKINNRPPGWLEVLLFRRIPKIRQGALSARGFPHTPVSRYNQSIAAEIGSHLLGRKLDSKSMPSCSSLSTEAVLASCSTISVGFYEIFNKNAVTD
jgi:hypothetical protein